MFSFRVKLKRGVILYTVLFVALILGLLTVWFFKSSQNARATAFRFEQSEVVRRLARGAADEAFMVAFKQTADPKSDVGKWLITQADKWFDNTGSFKSIPIPVSLSQAQANEIVKQRWT
ncbi:hypothetical protein HYY75_05565 [bacterium]|nr:hypothetical protein [bacterium]